jgi:hypothetical protein
MTKKYIPPQDGELATWITGFMQNIIVIGPRVNFPESVQQEIMKFGGDFNQKYLIAKDPATRTTVTIKAKDEARKKLEEKIRSAVNEYLAYNHLVTDEDKVTLGLHVRDPKPTPSPISDVPPSIEARSGTAGNVDFHIIGPKPLGQHGAEIVWAVLDTKPIGWKDLTHSSFCTRSPLRLSFDGEDRGKTLYFAARWENTRGEKGVWSEIMNVIIP